MPILVIAENDNASLKASTLNAIAAARAISFVRNFYLEHEEDDSPYLGFFLQTAGVGLVLALVVYLCGQLVLGAAFSDDVLASAAAFGSAHGAADAGGEVVSAAVLGRCFMCAAVVVFASCASSVVYLKLLSWRDEHDKNTSGTAMSVVAVLIACIAFSVLATLAIFFLLA